MIENSAGYVFYDYQQHDALGNVIPGATPPGPAWLRKLLGDDDLFTNVTEVDFRTGRQPSFRRIR